MERMVERSCGLDVHKKSVTACVRAALAARYRRVMRRRGHKKAIIAVAHAMLVIAYHVLHDRTTYRELGPTYDEQRQATRARRRAIHTLEAQGYRVVLEPAA